MPNIRDYTYRFPMGKLILVSIDVAFPPSLVSPCLGAWAFHALVTGT